MEFDLAQLDSSALAQSGLLRAQFCIVGAGIAGLTLAHELVELGHEVLLLEAGSADESSNAANSEVIQAGREHPGSLEPAVHAFGGTSLIWGGQLLPLPAEAEWPVSAMELAPFSTQAERLLGVDELSYDASRFFNELRKPMPAQLQTLSQLEPWLSKFAPFSRRNLAHTIGGQLRSHSKARVILHARATELLLSPARDRIEAVLVSAPSGETHRIEAEHVLVAAGTVETVRLMLASRSIAPEGVGNAHDQVGRNFHDHLTVTAATLNAQAREMLLSLRPWVHRGTLHSLKLSADSSLRRELGLNAVMAHLTIEEPAESGIGTIRNLLRARQQHHAGESARESILSLPSAMRDGVRLAISAGVKGRRYVSPRAVVKIRLNAAQRAPAASRITLSEELNPVLDWRVDGQDCATLRRFANHLRTKLQTAGIDWAATLFEPDAESPIAGLDDARHAMGGACMGADPRGSVVNHELRVHGLQNLFVASAAVFPDGSPQLPTLPLMALALRLAQHLHRRI